jgi:hypothetical protein
MGNTAGKERPPNVVPPCGVPHSADLTPMPDAVFGTRPKMLL